jgi:NAD(P)-dependent dehydrogenase (short-subunit alcohol dehydrogenase family)
MVGCDVDGEAGEATADKIRAAGGQINFSTVDVSRESAVEALVARAVDEHGRLDCAINNAFPVGRMGRPEELVAAAMYLCSDEARFCTGTTLVLDGGFTAQ